MSKLVRLFSVNSDLSDKYSLSFNLVLVGIAYSFLPCPETKAQGDISDLFPAR